MVQRVQVVALAISVALGGALVTGLTLGSREAPVHVGPTTLPAVDLVDVYSTIVVNLAGAAGAGSQGPHGVSVSRSIYDSCPPRVGTEPPKRPGTCGRTKVGKLKPDIEAALYEALARHGITPVFADDGQVRLHQVVTEASGTPAADGNVGDSSEMKFHFKPVKGRLQLQNVTIEWVK